MIYDPTALIAAWEAHDRWCLSLSPTPPAKQKRLPYNGGGEITARLHEEQARAAHALGIGTHLFVAAVTLERCNDPGPDIAGAVNRVLLRIMEAR